MMQKIIQQSEQKGIPHLLTKEPQKNGMMYRGVGAVREPPLQFRTQEKRRNQTSSWQW